MPKVIVLSSKKGGSGKSTLCQALAVEAGSSKILDMDPQLDSVAWSIARTKKLPDGQQIPAFKVKTAAEIIKLIADADEDFIFIDTPPIFEGTHELRQVWQLADLVVVPFQTSGKSVRSGLRTVHELDELKVKYKALLIISNIIARVTGATRNILTREGVNLLKADLRTAAVYETASFSGRVPQDIAKSSTASKELAAAWIEIKRNLK